MFVAQLLTLLYYLYPNEMKFRNEVEKNEEEHFELFPWGIWKFENYTKRFLNLSETQICAHVCKSPFR